LHNWPKDFFGILKHTYQTWTKLGDLTIDSKGPVRRFLLCPTTLGQNETKRSEQLPNIISSNIFIKPVQGEKLGGAGGTLTIANKVNCYCRNARQQRPAKHMKFRFSFTSFTAPPPRHAPGGSRKKDIMGEGRDTTKNISKKFFWLETCNEVAATVGS